MSTIRLVFLISVLVFAANAEDTPKNPDLIDIQSVAPSIRVDLRYATPDNFFKKAVYGSNRCYVLRPVTERLSKVQQELESLGLGLKIWDGYRPLSVQKKFWAIVPDERYVASPVKGSRHNRGAAVDVTLVDREGREVEMPTKFDDFSEAAAADAPCSERAAENRKLLRTTMEKHGFRVLPTEWWHFDAVGWEKYPVLDIAIEKLAEADAK